MGKILISGRIFWLGDISFAHYNLVYCSNVTVAEVFSDGMDTTSFRRTLWGETLIMRQNLQEDCRGVTLAQGGDKIMWKLTPNKQFTVKSFYRALKTQGVFSLKNSCGKQIYLPK